MIPTLTYNFEGFNTSVGEVTIDVVEIAREQEIPLEPDDVAELLPSYDKTFKDEELFLTDDQRK